MNNNISKALQDELEKILSKTFFYKEPTNMKTILYSITYILIALLGSLSGLDILAAGLSVFPLAYVLGAKGKKVFIVLALVGAGISYAFSTPFMTMWFLLHGVIAYIFYMVISKRYSKIELILIITTVLFAGVAIYTGIMYKLGLLHAEDFFAQVSEQFKIVADTNSQIDSSLIESSLENIKKVFPVTIFLSIFIYSLILVQSTLTLLAREYVIIPSFPKFSVITLGTRVAYFYTAITFISVILDIENTNNYDFFTILVSNLVGIMGFAFMLNGLFMCFYFVELRPKSEIAKVSLVVLMVMFSPIFEMLGFVDSLFRVRERFAMMRKDK